MTDRFKKTLICFGAGLVLFITVCLLRGTFSAGVEKLIMGICDGAFAAFAVLTGLGALVWVSSNGLFDGLGYLAATTRRLPKKIREDEKEESYMDYKERMASKRQGHPAPLIFAGLAWLAVSIIFLIIYFI